MEKFKLICMSFDGEYQKERPEFETIDDAWNYSNDLGAKWFFYPFHFVVKSKTIKDAVFPLDVFIGRRIETIKRIFYKQSKKPETEGMDPDEFVFSL